MTLRRYFSIVFAVLLALGMLTAGLLRLSDSVDARYTTTNTVHYDDCGSLAGVISTDTELPENCDYIVNGNLLVPEGVTLTIHPGVRLRFSGSYYLKIAGRLLAAGTAEKRIVFTSGKSNPLPGDWIAVALVGSEQSVITYATVEYGGQYYHPYDAAVYAENGPHLIDRVIFRENGTPGVLRLNGNHTVKNSLFIDNISLQLIFLYGGASNVLANTFRNNYGTIIVVGENYVDSQFNLIKGNYFEGNISSGNVYLYTGSSRALIRENVFISNTTISNFRWPGIIKIENTQSVTVECNLFLNNVVTSSYEFNPGGVIMVDVNPIENVLIKHNNIYPGNGDYDLAASFSVDSPESSIDARHNYWDTVNALAISARIYDYYDDFNLPEVLFTPYEASPVPCAPTLPPNASFDDSAPDWLGQNTIFTNTTVIIPNDPSITYLWSFGDGITSTQTNPTHTYSQAGLYTAALTATNAAGSDVATDTLTIYGPPTAHFTSNSNYEYSP